MSTLEVRVDNLERSLARSRLAFLFAATIAFGVILGFKPQAEPVRTIRASAFIVVDEQGREVAELSAASGGGSLTLHHGDNDWTHVRVIAKTDGGELAIYDDREGLDPRVRLTAGTKRAGLAMGGVADIPVVGLVAGGQVGGSLQLHSGNSLDSVWLHKSDGSFRLKFDLADAEAVRKQEQPVFRTVTEIGANTEGGLIRIRDPKGKKIVEYGSPGAP